MTANGDVMSGCRIREILERVGDKWSLQVIFHLGGGPLNQATAITVQIERHGLVTIKG